MPPRGAIHGSTHQLRHHQCAGESMARVQQSRPLVARLARTPPSCHQSGRTEGRARVRGRSRRLQQRIAHVPKSAHAKEGASGHARAILLLSVSSSPGFSLWLPALGGFGVTSIGAASVGFFLTRRARRGAALLRARLFVNFGGWGSKECGGSAPASACGAGRGAGRRMAAAWTPNMSSRAGQGLLSRATRWAAGEAGPAVHHKSAMRPPHSPKPVIGARSCGPGGPSPRDQISTIGSTRRWTRP